MADGAVVFEIKGDAKGINAVIKNVTSDIEKESRKWDDAVDDAAGSMEGSFMSFVKGIAGGLAAAGIGKMLLDIGKDAVSAASDLEEVQNVVDVTFGDNASKIETWAQKAGQQYGLTETAAKRYTSTIGAMLKSQGMADEEIVKTSTDLAGLAADMASFYNLDFDTAFQKIKSGISGETEPLKQLGINMSAANLEAFRLEKGLTKAYSAMSQSEQTALRYQYIMQATADAQGDFARTSDGMANATRRVETAVDTIKTKLGQLFLPAIADATDALATFLSKLTEKPETTVLDDFAEIDKDIATKMASLESTYAKAKDILEVIKEISNETTTLSDGSTITFGELFENIANIEASGGDIGEYIQGLGLDVDYVTMRYKEWKGAVEQLADTVPELTAAINSETGAIEGGTDALEENFKAWNENEKKKILWAGHYAKKRALAEKEAQLWTYQLEVDTAQKAAKRIKQEISDAYGVTWDGDEVVVSNPDMSFSQRTQLKIDLDKQYGEAITEVEKAQANLEKQTVDFTDAQQNLADEEAALLDLYGKVDEAATGSAKATAAWTADQKSAGQAVIENIKALEDYVIAVHDATEAAVNGVVKGFDKISRPTSELEKKRSDLIEQQMKLNLTTEEGVKEYERLQKQIDELNKSIREYQPAGMQDALTSQLAFMDEYITNLEKAQKMGLSDELLSFLSDGSVESAEYLSQLVANPEQAAQVDALYQQVQAKKKQFTDALTEQKLTVDETYQGMVDKAKQSNAEMNLGEEAKEAMACAGYSRQRPRSETGSGRGAGRA